MRKIIEVKCVDELHPETGEIGWMKDLEDVGFMFVDDEGKDEWGFLIIDREEIRELIYFRIA